MVAVYWGIGRALKRREVVSIGCCRLGRENVEKMLSILWQSRRGRLGVDQLLPYVIYNRDPLLGLLLLIIFIQFVFQAILGNLSSPVWYIWYCRCSALASLPDSSNWTPRSVNTVALLVRFEHLMLWVGFRCFHLCHLELPSYSLPILLRCTPVPQGCQDIRT